MVKRWTQHPISFQAVALPMVRAGIWVKNQLKDRLKDNLKGLTYLMHLGISQGQQSRVISKATLALIQTSLHALTSLGKRKKEAAGYAKIKIRLVTHQLVRSP